MSTSQPKFRNLEKQEHLFKHLRPNEIERLDNIIEHNCHCISAAVVQVLCEHERRWRKQACGILCFLADYNKRIYCFRLYDLWLGRSIDEEFVPSHLQLDQVQDLFYTFNGTKCRVGINFADRLEADIFRERFRMKQQSRQKKKQTRAPMPAPQINTKPVKKSSIWSLFGKKDPVISQPLYCSFTHTASVTPTKNFVNDDSQKQMFQAVLDSMNLPSKEKRYIREVIEQTEGALAKLFIPTLTNGYNQQQPQQSIRPPPPVPPRVDSETHLHENHSPSIAVEVPVASSRPAAPAVPPRLAPCPPTEIPPPPPITPALDLSTPVSLAPLSNPNSGSFLHGIANFNRTDLKVRTCLAFVKVTASILADYTTRSPAPEKVEVNTQRTLEENIQQMIICRRPFIRVSTSESSDSEWDDDADEGHI